MKTDGDGTLWLHQSDIKHFLTCPDQFRIVNGIEPGGSFEKIPEGRVETDAATVGTVFHATIEHELNGERFARCSDAQRWARNTMAKLVIGYIEENVEYRTESFGDDPKRALSTLDKLVARWFASEERKLWLALVNDHPECVHVEWNFDVPFLENRPGIYKNVRLTGTADILDTYFHRMVDWKTSSRRYERWEKQRWDVQATVYTFAAATEGLLQRHDDGYKFQFKVFNHKYDDAEPQEVEVWRDVGQWGWLTQQVSNMVAMIESDLPVWPLRDDHALCGPKWCPVWDSCKGVFVTHPEWK